MRLSNDEIRSTLLKRIAKGLREFGYPDATNENVLTEKVFALFARRDLDEALEARPDLAPIIQPMLNEIERVTA